MADYDSAEVTDRERQAADHLGTIAGYNAQSTHNQLKQQLGNYDMADQQNRSLADVQRDQNSRKAASERFGQNKKLQSSTQGLLGAAGNALNGTGLYRVLDMLATRTDLDNNEVWNALAQNQNTVENAYNESVSQNVLARNDAASNAEFALRGINADTAAQLNNITPSLFVEPGEGDAGVAKANGVYEENKRPANQAQLSGYIMPDDAITGARRTQKPNTMSGNSYYDKLVNGYNRRS